MGGSFGLGGATGGAQDPSQTGKGKPGVAGWSVQGYNAVTNREQQVRATVGAGDLVVRNDATTGNDSTAGLNRDPSKAYEITRDEQHRTDVYASGSSIGAVLNPTETLDTWKENLQQYGKGQEQLVTDAVSQVLNAYKAHALTVDQVPAATRAQLGNESALMVAKALVAGGVSADILSKIKPDGIDALQQMVMLGEDIVRCNKGCATDASGAPQQTTGVMAPTANDNVTTLPVTDVTASDNIDIDITAADAFFSQVAILAQSVDPENLEVAMLATQAAMGPAKFLISQALQAALKASGADKRIEEKKRDAAIYVVSELTDQSEDVVREDDKEARKAYAEGTAIGIDKLLDGTESVVGAKFIVDSLLQVTVGAVGKAAGRVVSVTDQGGGKQGSPFVIEPKISQQMGKRGWTAESLDSVLKNPSKTVATKDTRFDPISGKRLNDPATGYVAKDGSYVVKNDRTGAIVQVSDKNEKNWIAPWD